MVHIHVTVGLGSVKEFRLETVWASAPASVALTARGSESVWDWEKEEALHLASRLETNLQLAPRRPARGCSLRPRRHPHCTQLAKRRLRL
jgi:hypothetical protein